MSMKESCVLVLVFDVQVTGSLAACELGSISRRITFAEFWSARYQLGHMTCALTACTYMLIRSRNNNFLKYTSHS